MPDLEVFQRSFARALLGEPWPHDASTGSTLLRGLAIHRNTVLKALIDALADNYPTVARLVGRKWFDGCAGEFVRARAPEVPMLALYGTGFAEYLATFPPAEALPYLPDVARIDRLWLEAHLARDASPLPSGTLAVLTPERIFEQRLELHPAARFGWFNHSAATIWLHNRPPAPATEELEIDGASEGLLLTRARGPVEAARIDVATFTFLNAIQDGATLGAAATAALAVDTEADIATHLAKFINAGVFARLRESQARKESP